MGPVDNQPSQYISTADGTFTDLYHRLQEEVTTLAGVLKGCGGMAGSDNAGEAFAKDYDPAAGGRAGAAGAMEAASACVNAAGSFRDLLHATGTNYANADNQSAIDASHQPAVPPDSLPIFRIPNVPLAFGGGSDPPGWWGTISGWVQGEVWPNGKQDELQRAAAAWKAAGTGFTTRAAFVDIAVNDLRAQKAPEVDDAVAAITDLKNNITAVGSEFAQMGEWCEQYAQHIDDVHHEIMSELKSLLGWTVAIEGIAALGALFTLGGSEGVGQAVEAGRLAAAGAKIAEVIRTFAAAVEGLGMFGPAAVRTFAGATETMGPWAGAQVIVAGMDGVKGTEAIAEISKGFRRPYIRQGVVTEVEARTPQMELNGQKYYVTGEDENILIPVDKTYHDSSIPGLDKTGYPGAPQDRFYTDGEHWFPVEPKYDLGHSPGDEWWRMKEMAESKGWTQKELNDYANNPDLYRIEDQYTNRSHRSEMPREGE